MPVYLAKQRARSPVFDQINLARASSLNGYVRSPEKRPTSTTARPPKGILRFAARNMCNKTGTHLSDRRTYKHFAAVIKKQGLKVLTLGVPLAQLPRKIARSEKAIKRSLHEQGKWGMLRIPQSLLCSSLLALVSRSGMSKFPSAQCGSSVSFLEPLGTPRGEFFKELQLLQFKLQLHSTCRLLPARRQIQPRASGQFSALTRERVNDHIIAGQNLPPIFKIFRANRPICCNS